MCLHGLSGFFYRQLSPNLFSAGLLAFGSSGNLLPSLRIFVRQWLLLNCKLHHRLQRWVRYGISPYSGMLENVYTQHNINILVKNQQQNIF
jgi:hypothetical protein